MKRIMKPLVGPEHEVSVPPACRATTDRIQRTLDGELAVDRWPLDAHIGECGDCRERIHAMRLLLAALAVPRPPITVPAGLSKSILASVHSDRRDRARVRMLARVGSFALAASVALVVWLNVPTPSLSSLPTLDVAVSTPKPEVPDVKPMRLGDELAKAGVAFRTTTQPLTEPAAAAPTAFASITNALLHPPTPMAVAKLEPARKSLAELPEAARIGFQPVTGSAEKALNRFLRDLVAIKPNS